MALGFLAYLDKPGITERSKMLGRLRLPDAKSFGDSAHRKRCTKQKVDDLEAAWFSESSESFKHSRRLFHDRNILVKEYKKA